MVGSGQGTRQGVTHVTTPVALSMTDRKSVKCQYLTPRRICRMVGWMDSMEEIRTTGKGQQMRWDYRVVFCLREVTYNCDQGE